MNFGLGESKMFGVCWLVVAALAGGGGQGQEGGAAQEEQRGPEGRVVGVSGGRGGRGRSGGRLRRLGQLRQAGGRLGEFLRARGVGEELRAAGAVPVLDVALGGLGGRAGGGVLQVGVVRGVEAAVLGAADVALGAGAAGGRAAGVLMPGAEIGAAGVAAGVAVGVGAFLGLGAHGAARGGAAAGVGAVAVRGPGTPGVGSLRGEDDVAGADVPVGVGVVLPVVGVGVVIALALKDRLGLARHVQILAGGVPGGVGAAIDQARQDGGIVGKLQAGAGLGILIGSVRVKSLRRRGVEVVAIIYSNGIVGPHEAAEDCAVCHGAGIIAVGECTVGIACDTANIAPGMDSADVITVGEGIRAIVGTSYNAADIYITTPGINACDFAGVITGKDEAARTGVCIPYNAASVSGPLSMAAYSDLALVAAACDVGCVEVTRNAANRTATGRRFHNAGVGAVTDGTVLGVACNTTGVTAYYRYCYSA